MVVELLRSSCSMSTQIQFIGASSASRFIREEIEYASQSDAKVLITGESGVGKEVVAQMVHQQSRRRTAPLVTINCAGVPDTLLASELFGHMRGSFTDAHRDKPGWLEQANRGTIFLDEVGEMSLQMQSLLLRFLENGEIQRVGSEKLASKVDVRVIAATNRKLADRIASGEFREDLFYRLERDSHPDSAAARAARRYSAAARPLSSNIQQESRRRAPAPQRRGGRAADRERLARQRASSTKRRRAPRPQVEERHHHHRRPAERGAVCKRAGSRTLGRAPGRPVCEQICSTEWCANGETFWTIVYEPFMLRDLTRERSPRDCAPRLESHAGQLQGHGAAVQRSRRLQAAAQLPAQVSVPSSDPGIPDGFDPAC